MQDATLHKLHEMPPPWQAYKRLELNQQYMFEPQRNDMWDDDHSAIVACSH